jgi:hypothetical protein
VKIIHNFTSPPLSPRIYEDEFSEKRKFILKKEGDE